MSEHVLTFLLGFVLLVVCTLAVRLLRLHRTAQERLTALVLAEETHQMRDQTRRNEMLESLLEGLGEACLIVTPELEVAFANPEAAELFHTSRSPVGQHLCDVFPDPRLTEVAERSLRDHAPVEQNLKVIMRVGSDELTKYLVISAAPIRLPGSGPADYLRVIVRDETQQRETEQIRKDFVANASHELRTPLSIINGYLENLVEGLIDHPDMVRKSLLTMQKHSLRLARIVEDMLTISRFESVGEQEAADLLRHTFSVKECVKDVLDRLHPLIEEKTARIITEFPDDPEACRMAGDRFYWDQIFFNLIENALKENQQPGLTIHVGMTQSLADGVRLWVRDNGVGIPRADLPFIFKRFYRVAKHHNQETKGTGLGLSIVRRAVEAHGGVITVDSLPGERTEFAIIIPPRPAPTPSTAN